MYLPDLPPEARAVEPEEPYATVRGTCPRCGSVEVVHLVIGMPAQTDDVGRGPDWERWVGCVHPAHDRECRSCGAHWVAGRQD